MSRSAAASVVRPVGHDEKLTVTAHISELRVRIILCAVVFGAVFGICLWQNNFCLSIINRPLDQTATKHASGPLGSTTQLQQQSKKLYTQLAVLSNTAANKLNDPDLQREFKNLANESNKAAAAIPRDGPKLPVTLSVGEPLTVTLQVAFYAALLLSLPFLLFQLYGFLLPAFTRRERKVAIPVMLTVPLLFIAGAIFGYFIVLPRAIAFLQQFNTESFDVLLQARDYYRFAIMFLIAMGLVFQVPVLILAVTSLGILTPAQLKANRRYAILAIAIIAMFMPGPDPLSMLLAMIPLLLLFEASILMSSILVRNKAKAQTRRQADH